MAWTAVPFDRFASVVQALLALFWILCVAAGIGSKLLRSQDLGLPPTLRRVLQIAFGLGVLAYGIFAVGLLGGLYAWLLLTALGALTLVCLPAIKREQSLAFKALLGLWRAYRTNAWLWSLGALVTVTVAYVSIYALAPEVAFDSVCFYLEYAHENLKAHRILFHANLRSTHQPYTPVQLYQLGLALAGTSGAKLIHFLFGCLVGLWIYGICSPKSRKMAALGVLLFVLIPVIQWEASTAMLDLPYTLFALCAITPFLSKPLTFHGVAISGLFFGLSLASKHHALLFAPLFCLVFVSDRELPWRALGCRVALFFSVALVVVFPWYLKSYRQVGNPVFPLLQSYFKSAYTNERIIEIENRDRAQFGTGKNLVSLVKLPFDLATKPSKYKGTPGVLISLLLPFLWLASRRHSKSEGRPLAVLQILAYGYTLLWFWTVQEIRFLVPAMPLYAVLAAHLLWPPPLRLPSRLLFAAVVLYTLCYLPPIYWRLSQQFQYRLNLDAPAFETVLGYVDNDAYIATEFPGIYVYRYINSRLPGDSYILSADGAAYYCERPYLYPVSPDGTFILDYPDLKRIYHRARQLGITHVVVDLRWIRGNKEAEQVLETLRSKYLGLVYAANDVELYRVR